MSNKTYTTPAIETVKPGSRINFVTGPGFSPENPSETGIAYGLRINARWGNQLKVKCTDSAGNVTFHYITGFTTVGIGAYFISPPAPRKPKMLKPWAGPLFPFAVTYKKHAAARDTRTITRFAPSLAAARVSAFYMLDDILGGEGVLISVKPLSNQGAASLIEAQD